MPVPQPFHWFRRSLDRKPVPFRKHCARPLQLELLDSRVVPTMILPLVNQTGLNASEYSVYALGYSVASNLWLDGTGHFVDSSAMTSLPAHNITDLPAITINTGQQVVGARVAFFVTPFNAAPTPFTRLSGGGVIQPTNPPNSNYPPFDIAELTNTATDSFIIDVQTVDGFIFPLTLTLNDGLGQVGTTLPAAGQGAVVTRQGIFPAYQAFMTDPQLGGAGTPYLDLLFKPGEIAGQYGGIVNPGRYLDAANGNAGSPLNTVFDSTLSTLFTDASLNLSIIGDDNHIYTGVPMTDGMGRQVLQFTGGGNIYRVYNPLTPDPLGPLPTSSPGYMVFGNDGSFADASPNAIVSGPAFVALGIQRDLVSALNRGIATRAPTSGTPGYSSKFWGTEANWYPTGATMNLFSLFMHAGKVGGQSIYVNGAAYGFAYDESPVHGPNIPQPLVPSKFDPVPAGTTSVTITLGPWFDSAPAPGNDPPSAVADVAATQAGTPVTVDVRTNDSDPNGDALTVTAVTQGSHGIVVVNTNGTLTYTPAAGFSGSDQFSYTISDGHGGSASASVTITVAAPSLVNVPASLTVVPGASITFDAAATNAEGTWTFSLLNAPRGAAIDPTTGAFIWTPDENTPLGSLSFSVVVTDDKNLSVSQTVNVEVADTALINGNLLVSGTSGKDVIIVRPVTRDAGKVEVVRNKVSMGQFDLASITGKIGVFGHSGNDRITLAPTLKVGAELFGGAGNDTLIGGTGNDSLCGGAGNDVLTGRKGNDTYYFADSWGVDRIVEGLGGGIDRMDFSAATVDVTFALNGPVVARNGLNVARGRVEGITGGAGNDTFRFAAGRGVAGTIDGGGGTNTLNYAAYTTRVRVNLLLGTATRTGGISNIANVIGGRNHDILVGNGQANMLTGNSGRDILIGGAGADSLAGGAGDDILIGGTTDQDDVAANLDALMAAWARALPYASRITNLGTLLNESAVHDDDGAADMLSGGLGLDWFHTSLGDTITDKNTGGTETETGV